METIDQSKPFTHHRGHVALAFALRALISFAIGALFLLRPGSALGAIVLLFGAFAFADGIVALAVSLFGHGPWQMAVVGVLGILVGIITFRSPGLTAVTLYAWVAIWMIGRGIFELVLAVRLKHLPDERPWLALDGVLSIALGVLLIVLPRVGVLSLAWTIGLYAVAMGFLQLMLAFRLRRVMRDFGATGPTTVQPA
jgi:uncharacterized membrane protein HdeD (DUF308 family)